MSEKKPTTENWERYSDMEEKNNKPGFGARIGGLLTQVIRFITYDIWRITENEITGIKRFYIYLVKTIILAIRGFQRDNIQTKASALTFSTLLAIVPLLAVLVGIASGFGFSDTVRESMYSYFPGQTDALEQAFNFADNYLRMAQGGVFIGIGLSLLLYTVINLISAIESAFNDIWQVKSSRPWRRKITDYLALFIILPAMMTLSGGLSLFLSTIPKTYLNEFVFLSPVTDKLLSIAPYVITVLIFTALFILIPNTKVRFWNALSAGFITGLAFQIFQFVYISGQIWVSKYNTIYGSFAALPLLLLWLQLSWLLCLFGAEIAYASQNVKKFSFERDSRNISRRYKDFLILLIVSLIIKRFEKGEKPYSADELSEANRIPIRLTTDILYHLTELGIITEVLPDKDERVIYYQPALDIQQISIGFLWKKIDEFGSENFKIDTSRQFKGQWEALLKIREKMIKSGNEVLLKDL